MSPELKTRRTVLASALGAAGAATVATLAGPAAALAENGQPVLLGVENTATTYTRVVNTTPGTPQAGLIGYAAAGVGVVGESVDGQGVIGRSTNGRGVQAYSEHAFALDAFGPSGVWADATYSEAIHGRCANGTAIIAESANGTALDVRGKAKFSRAKRVTIAAGKSSLRVTLARVTTASLVFAVLHSNRSGWYVRAVVPATGYFTIYLNKTLASASYVAYFVVN